MTSSTEEYLRVVIEGELAAESSLHVGDGAEQEFSKRGGRAAKAQGHYSTVCLDKDGKAYLPGRTLRGFLRDSASGNPVLQKKLFGYEDRQGGQCGPVRVYDARIVECSALMQKVSYVSQQRGTGVAHHVAIEPITGTADEHKLFRREFVPAGTRFKARFEANDITKGDLSNLLRLLSTLDGTVNASVGRGVSKAHGRLKWTRGCIKVLSKQRFAAWLASDDGNLDHWLEGIADVQETSPLQTAGPDRLGGYRLKMISPLLVNDPGQASGKDGEPDLEFARTPDGKPMIPAESIAGMVRARSRRILATLLHANGAPAERASELAEKKLNDVFGATGRRSTLRFDDAVAGAQQDGIVQWFNAIDRFTGSVDEGSKTEQGAKKGGKLYQARSACNAILTGNVYLDERPAKNDEGWWKGLLLLALRDAMEGDLSVGWGKARGYGRFLLELSLPGEQEIKSWGSFLEYLKNSGKRPEADSWVNSLKETAKARGEAAKAANKGTAKEEAA
jgi:CRISPR/Cas system CSM-associated protein Csm3 (group 7 of RAMP superfamily)